MKIVERLCGRRTAGTDDTRARSSSGSGLRLAFILAVIPFFGRSDPLAGQADSDLPVQYRIDRWTTEQGLPQNTVRAVHQTRDGYLWIGTSYGLARYDGIRLKDYTAELMLAGVANLQISQVAEDSDGRLWIRTPDELCSYYQHRFQPFSLKSGLLKGTLQTMAPRRLGGLWLAMWDGLKHFQDGALVSTIRHRENFAADAIEVLREDSSQRLWVRPNRVNREAGWLCYDPAADRVQTVEEAAGFNPGVIQDIYHDRSGRIWFLTPEEFICQDGKTRLRYPAPFRPNSIQEELDGTFWFTSGVELVRFHKGEFTALGRREGIASSDLRTVLLDREANIWVGTGDGLQRLQRRRFTTLLSENERGQKNEVYAVCSGGDGRVWLGTSSALTLLSGNQMTAYTNHVTKLTGRIENSASQVLEDSSGRIWCGLHNEGLSKLTDGRYQRVPIPGIPASTEWSVRAVLEDHTGQIWVGTDRLGLLRLNGGEIRRYTIENGLPANTVTSVCEAPDGSLWLGTGGGGIAMLKDGHFRTFTMHNGLLSNYAWVLRIEASGTVWIGTPLGLNRLRAGVMRSVTAREGLFDNLAYSLLDDGRGNYWAHCNRGIWRVRQADLHAVADGCGIPVECVSYGEADGMRSTEGNGESQPNAARTPDGRLWFPTTHGVVVVDPKTLLENETAPPVVIEQVIADGELIHGDGAKPAKSALGMDRRLPPGRARVLEIHYTANSFVAPEKVRFRYRLSGVDANWRDGAGNRVVYYTNLRPGNYRFQVKACNNHGYWNERGATFAFSLAPHFWQTSIFYGLCGTAAVLLAGGVQGYRLRVQRRILRLEHQRAMAQERARLARELHDDLGTALTGLALEMDVMQRAAGPAPGLSARLRSSAGRARELARHMREVVWAVSPACDNIPSLAKFLEQHAVLFVQAAGLKCRLELPENLPERPLSSSVRHELALSVREALNNVVRHARASEVILSLQLDAHALTIRIGDNGIGFDPARLNGAGHGLANLRSRLEPFGGAMTLQSETGRGTTLTLRIPIPARGEGAGS